MTYYVRDTELYHHGVKGMKWGHRKAKLQSSGGGRTSRKTQADNSVDEAARTAANKKKAKRAIAIGSAAVGTALAAYGAYKVSAYAKSGNRAELASKARAMLAKHRFDQSIVNGVDITRRVSGAANASGYISGAMRSVVAR